jgi:hypothetical protein
VIDRIEAAASVISVRVASLDTSDTAELEVETRALLRLIPELDSLHRVVATYGGDVGRQDLAVGLLHLVDRLIADVLPNDADPIIHLDNDYMYSTLPLVQYLVTSPSPADSTTAVAAVFDEPHPVVFNLPALDPTNALLAPILAHEVGHSASRTKLIQDTMQVLPISDLQKELSAQVAKLAPTQQASAVSAWINRFYSWLEELLCDAIATVLTGPSFLFASAVFLPAPAAHSVGSHPHERDRIAFCLRLLEHLGWTPFLEQRVPSILEWCTDLGTHPILDNTAEEAFLRKAMELAEPHLVAVATGNVVAALDPSEVDGALNDSLTLLALEVPPIEAAGRLLSLWEIVLFGWISEIEVLGGAPEHLAAAAGNKPLNAFLIKTLELVSVRRLWEEADGNPPS